MADEAPARDITRDALRAEVRARLPSLCGPLRILAERILGAEAPIDLLALTPEGRLVVVLLGDAERDLELVGLALAQRAWVERRRRDLAQLVPGVRADLAVQVVLLAPGLGSTARLALESIAGENLVFGRILRPAGSAGVELVLDPAPARPEACCAEPQRAPEAPHSRFRSRLTDADLGLESDEPG